MARGEYAVRSLGAGELAPDGRDDDDDEEEDVDEKSGDESHWLVELALGQDE